MKLKFLTIVFLLIFASFNTALFSQEKVEPSMSLNYIKDYKDGPTIKVVLQYKEDKTYLPAQNVKLTLFKGPESQPDVENDDGQDDETLNLAKVSEVETNQDGEAYFYLKPDALGVDQQNYEVTLVDDPKFEDLTESITFQDAVIEASIIENEDTRSIQVKFTDAKGEPVAEQYLNIGLQRLFGVMQVGEEPYYVTDEQGEVVVDIQEELFSKSGKLDFIIKLDESDTYGTIIELVNGEFGTVMEAKDSYDERTMWASALKAPLVVMIVPNVLLLGIWGTILILIINLFKIYKLN